MYVGQLQLSQTVRSKLQITKQDSGRVKKVAHVQLWAESNGILTPGGSPAG